ncbi:MAG TPA: hypothetical protein VHC98_03930 [Candidatus Saccharimonadales bacterium]|nr:hypothetical protein [Candidatus Saccharimonadales bacterium]
MTYSNAISMSRGQYAGRNQNVVSFTASARGRLGPVSNTIILVVLACLLGLLYLTQVTKTNAYGYQINSLQEKQSQLQSEHDSLEVASARLQSLSRVEQSGVASAMVPTTPSGTVNQ